MRTAPASQTMLSLAWHGLFLLLPAVALASGHSPLLWLMVLTLVTAAVLVTLREKPLARLREVEWAGLLVIGWIMASPLWSVDPAMSVISALKTSGILLGGWLVWQSLNQRPSLLSYTTLATPVIGLGIAVLLGLMELLPSGGVLRMAYLWARGPEGNFIEADLNRGLCALGLMAWPAAFWLVRRGQRRWAFVLPLAMLPLMLVMHSLSAKLGLAAGYGIFLLTAWKPKWGRGVMLFLLPVLLFSWPWTFAHLGGAERPTALYQAIPLSAKHRLAIWEFAKERAEERPWLGWGMNTSRLMPGGMEEFSPYLVKMPLHPHNALMQIWLELGLVGLGVFLVAYLLVVRRWAQRPESDRLQYAIPAAAMVHFIAVSFSGFGLWQEWWLAMGWITAASIAAVRGLTLRSV